MAHFASHVVDASDQLAVDNETGANAGAERQEDHVSCALAGSITPLRKRARLCVVLDAGGQPEPLREILRQTHFTPSRQIWRTKDKAAFCIDRPANRRANCRDLRVRTGERFGLCQYVLEHYVRATICPRGKHPPLDDAAIRRSHDKRSLRTADVDTQ
jgi:hypothetical protein